MPIYNKQKNIMKKVKIYNVDVMTKIKALIQFGISD